MKLAMAALAVLLIGAAAAAAPLQPYQDFQVLYHANMGLLRGIPLYDRPGQVQMIAGIAGIPPSQVYVLPFPYPPWYALSTIWLARLPVDAAARVWFGLNLLMLVTSVCLMTRGEPLRRRALVLTGAILWVPSLGGLLVGQYGFPVLLGAALMVQALEGQKPPQFVLAAVLLSFKPHLGAAIVLLALVHLFVRRDRFSRSALLGLVAAGTMLFSVAFLASPLWPSAYIRSLMSFRGVHGVPQCTQCVSLPVGLSRIIGGGLGPAAWMALGLALPSSAWLIARWTKVSTTASGIVSIAALATLLISPYLLNYDYLLLLVPLISLAGRDLSMYEWIALGAAYVLPPIALALWGTAGNPMLIVSTCVVVFLILRHLRPAGQAVHLAA